jgi:glycosyltransferase involved in cell wall biosynthesis
MYNAEKYLTLAVDSVLAQTFESWELVLFDDGSRDRTLEIARTYAQQNSRIRVIQGENGGTAAARNRGFAATNAASEYVIFLDNDDVWEPDALEVLTRTLDEHPEYPAAHGLARAIDPHGNQFPTDDLAQSMAQRREVRDGRVTAVPMGAPTTFEALLIENYPVTPGTMLVRRSVWGVLGGYVPDAVPCDDWDMHLRIARKGGIILVDRVILNWRRHPGAASHTTTRWRKAYLHVRRRTIVSPENDPDQRSAAITAFRLLCRDTWFAAGQHLVAGRIAQGARALVRFVVYQTAYWRAVREPVAT